MRASELLHQISGTAFEDEALKPLLLDAPTVMGVESFSAGEITLRMVARTLPGKQFEVGRRLRVKVAETFQREGLGASADAKGDQATGAG